MRAAMQRLYTAPWTYGRGSSHKNILAEHTERVHLAALAECARWPGACITCRTDGHLEGGVCAPCCASLALGHYISRRCFIAAFPYITKLCYRRSYI